MKYKNQKLKERVQKLCEQQLQLKGSIDEIERQIDRLQGEYLQSSWLQGNVYVGWNKNTSLSSPSLHKIRINIDPKEKIFALSSLHSPAFASLSSIDRHLTPYAENRFEPKKKKRTLKRNTSQARRPRPIRKKRRR